MPDSKKIQKAIDFAKKAHDGQFRKSGEPYIEHPLAVMKILKSWQMDEDTLIAAILQQRTEKLSDIPEKLDFFDELPEYETSLFVHKKSKCDETVALSMLKEMTARFEAIEWTEEAIHDCLVKAAEELGAKNATVMWPVRIAVAGKAVTPGGAVEICHILGKEETLRRLALAMEKLG